MSRFWRVCSLSRRVFDEMTNKTPILFPLLLIVVVSVSLWLFSTAVSTLQALYLFGSHAGLTEIGLGSNVWGSQQEDGLISLSFLLLLAGVLFGSLEIVFQVVVRLILLGTYFYAVGRFLKMDAKWENWFGFACWTYLPMVIVPVAKTIAVLLSLGSGTSNTLLFMLWCVFVLLPIFWSFCITVQGLRSWTDKKTSVCIGIASVPYVVIVLFYAPSIL
ncbi:MAG: hypothetical protein F4Z01_08660 [Gammaproteobacteria bacterium]|nr:hypothetical protein [Gammaproteobacteria bacterium]MYF38773.1 hypothetical protein [Gammaproteobacteria bacterium]